MKTVLIILYTKKKQTLEQKWSILTLPIHPSPEKFGIPISQAFFPRAHFHEAALFLPAIRQPMSISCWVLHVFVLQAYIYLPLFPPQTPEQTVVTSLQLSQSYNLSKAVKAKFCTSSKKWTGLLSVDCLSFNFPTIWELNWKISSTAWRTDTRVKKIWVTRQGKPHSNMTIRSKKLPKVRSYKLVPKKVNSLLFPARGYQNHFEKLLDVAK